MSLLIAYGKPQSPHFDRRVSYDDGSANAIATNTQPFGLTIFIPFGNVRNQFAFSARPPRSR